MTTKRRSASKSWGKGKEALLFDLDGVLYESGNGYSENVRKRQVDFVAKHFAVEREETREMRNAAFKKHNQTLKGLKKEFNADIDHDEFTSYVRDGMFHFL